MSTEEELRALREVAIKLEAKVAALRAEKEVLEIKLAMKEMEKTGEWKPVVPND